MKIVSVILLAVTLSAPFITLAQDTFSKTTSELTFENSSEERFIETYVTEGSLSLHVNVECKLKQGGIEVEITNVETQKKYGSFVIGGSKSSKPEANSSVKEDVNSLINKVINNPKPGYYKIIIKAKQAEARLSVSVEQFYN